MSKIRSTVAGAAMAALALSIVPSVSGQVIDLNAPANYANQAIPGYIDRDNTPDDNPITDFGATLGRVLFHDVRLSRDLSVSCSSCHRQDIAFGDDRVASEGVSGLTGRHSMRLVNARFSNEARFFWDERAETLEAQATMPIRDHIEMGFSGRDGDPGFDALIARLEGTSEYPMLFGAAFGSTEITEDRMQRALAQFVRSIQSFDSRFDEGRMQVPNNIAPFPNFTNQENNGKALYLAPPQFNAAGQRVGGGAGCNACHRAPEFAIDPNSGNNGVIGALGGGIDTTVTRSPTLRDMLGPTGDENGLFFHTGGGVGPGTTLNSVLNHYNAPPPAVVNPGLDPRMLPAGNIQRLNLTPGERQQLRAFLRTLTGEAVYTDERWSDPFDASGALTLIARDGDIDLDGMTGLTDLLGVLSAWGDCPIENCPTDLDDDGATGLPDLLIVLGNWS